MRVFYQVKRQIINIQHVIIFISTALDAKLTPSVGVIRWDAWNQVNGQYDEISYYVHRELSPEEFHYRIPFYVSVVSPNNISFNADQQSRDVRGSDFSCPAGSDPWCLLTRFARLAEFFFRRLPAPLRPVDFFTCPIRPV